MSRACRGSAERGRPYSDTFRPPSHFKRHAKNRRCGDQLIPQQASCPLKLVELTEPNQANPALATIFWRSFDAPAWLGAFSVKVEFALYSTLSDWSHASLRRGRDVKLVVRAMDTAASIPKANLSGDLSALKRHFEISLYFLLLTGVLTLVSTGKLDLVSILLPPAALLFKGYRWWRGRGPELSNRVATWITIAYFVFFPFDLWVVSRILGSDAQHPGLYAALLATIHLMLFAIIVRLYSASTTRDYLFLTLMAFASMLASAILTVDTAFVVFFFVFLALAVSTFVGLEMWRSAQGAVTQPIANGTRAAHRLHNALGVTSAAIAFGSLAIGTVIFLFLPRFTGGYMSGFNLQPTLISGFSDDVELGEIGEIKKSSVVVMRIRVDGGLDAARGVHWRGVALTTFDGRRWYNEPHEPMTLTPASEGWFHLNAGETNRRRGGRPIQYTVLLEPIASTALFLVNDAESVRGRFNGEAGTTPWGQRRAYLLEDPTGSVFNPYHNFARMQYEARSVLPVPPAAALRQAGSDYSASMRETYLQLPKLDPRIPELAKQITARAETPYDKARALEGYLRSHYGYTLDLTGPPPSDPLAYFLFQKRAGHCEYFAAAMTVMLRSVGVPARYINGFQTGEYNDVGGDFVVRASDAHSWVEAYFPSFGWMTFDPTPPSDEKPPGMFALARALLGLVRTAVERMGHQLRLRASNHAGAKPAPRFTRLDRAPEDGFRGCAALRHGSAGTLAGQSRPYSGGAAGRTRNPRCTLYLCALAAAEGPPAAGGCVAPAYRSLRRDDAAPGDAAVQRNAAAARPARDPQGAGTDPARVCDIGAGRKSGRARARTDRDVSRGAVWRAGS